MLVFKKIQVKRKLQAQNSKLHSIRVSFETKEWRGYLVELDVKTVWRNWS